MWTPTSTPMQVYMVWCLGLGVSPSTVRCPLIWQPGFHFLCFVCVTIKYLKLVIYHSCCHFNSSCMVRGGTYQPLPFPRFDPNVTRVSAAQTFMLQPPVFQSADEWTFPNATHILRYRVTIRHHLMQGAPSSEKP